MIRLLAALLLVSLCATPALSKATADDIGKCMARVAKHLKDELKVTKTSNLNQEMLDWFCDDVRFQKRMSSKKNSGFCIEYEGTHCYSKDKQTKEAMDYRRKLCAKKTTKLSTKQTYFLVRSTLSKQAAKILDNCTKPFMNKKIDPLRVHLRALDALSYLATVEAIPINFGEVAPMLVKVESNMTCTPPAAAVPLSRKGISFVCRHKHGQCADVWIVAHANNGTSANNGAQVPAKGKAAGVTITYQTRHSKWTGAGSKTKTAGTTRAGIKCDDDGSYEGGHWNGNISVTVGANERITGAPKIWCPNNGSAHWTCANPSSSFSNGNRTFSAGIRHHSCTGITPVFHLQYSLERFITSTKNNTTPTVPLMFGGGTDVSVPVDAKNIGVMLSLPNGTKRIITGIDERGTTGEAGPFSAERVDRAVRIEASNKCL